MTTEEGIITENLYRFYHRIAALCGYETGQLAGCAYVWNRKGSWPGYLLGLPEPGTIPEIVGAIQQGIVPPFWILPETSGNEIDLLEAAGVRVVKQWSGMILDPVDFKPAPSLQGITIRINERETLEEWLQIVNSDLVSGAQIGHEIMEAIASSDDFQWMVAYMEDQPVGTGMVFSHEGIGGLYMLATRSAARGRGIGSAVFSEMTSLAIRSGNHTVVLHGTGLGERIYVRTGFSVVSGYSVLWNLGQ